MSCPRPRTTKRTINPQGKGIQAWCPHCKAWKPAAQVPPGREIRNTSGRITATYAPIPH